MALRAGPAAASAPSSSSSSRAPRSTCPPAAGGAPARPLHHAATRLRALSGIPDAETPPYALLSTPVYSLASRGAAPGSRATLNMITYASPIALRPRRKFALGLYVQSLTYANVKETGRAVLQILPQTAAALTQLLGKTSGRDADKVAELAALGWAVTEEFGLPVLADAIGVVDLRVETDFIPAGDHEVVVCDVAGWKTLNAPGGPSPPPLPGAPRRPAAARRRRRRRRCLWPPPAPGAAPRETATRMTSKEERPTLAGVNVRTRKRNIVVPADPGSFATAIVQIFQDAADGASIEKDLEAGVKVLDSADLDFSRYADTLFEVLFAGGRLSTGGNLADDQKDKLATNVLAAEPTPEALLPYIKVFQSLIRRRPFLVKGLEATLNKFILSLEFYDEPGRKKIATTAAMVFSHKLALPENVLQTLLNDRLVAKGSVLSFTTTFFQVYLAKEPLDDLVTLLSKGRVVNRLLEIMPPSKRSMEAFAAHFNEAGLGPLVEWNTRREIDIKVAELQEGLSGMMAADPPHPLPDVIAYVKARKAEQSLPDADVVRVIWVCMFKSINMTGKNQSQILQAVVSKIKQYHKLLATFVTNAKLELTLLVTLQVLCYEDTRLLKLFSDIVKLLYNADLVGEDTITHWHKKGSHPKGRNVFLKDMEPFIKWLEEAEEEDDEGDA
ncbi:BZW1 [Scenedesmus sp. PABB004]|nr:BZW1 [Scenedesmus sp. PABB004]